MQTDLFLALPPAAAKPAAPAPRKLHPVFTEPRGPFCYGCLRYAPPRTPRFGECPRCHAQLSGVGVRGDALTEAVA